MIIDLLQCVTGPASQAFKKEVAMNGSVIGFSQLDLLRTSSSYSIGHSQHNTDFAKTNQNEVVRFRTNFFEDFRIRKLIRENQFVILNL